MDLKKNRANVQMSGTTLRRPVQIVKKSSGPLEDVIDELHQDNNDKSLKPPTDCHRIMPKIPIIQSIGSAWQETPVGASLKLPTFSVIDATPQPTRRRPIIKEKEKKRERWLLTRKTWKYMTDAGRKLIPDDVQNRKEDISKVEAHFQQVCANEPKFILWRRKCSYPGALRNSKRRLKNLLQHTAQKSPLTMEALEEEEVNNADQCIDLLQLYLKLHETCKTTTLLSSKTVRPDQTASPSARRPDGREKTSHSSMTSHSFLVPQVSQCQQKLNENDLLLERLKQLARSTVINSVMIPPENITSAILEDKVLLKQLYNSLKKQQLHRALCNYSTSSLKSPQSKLKHSSSLSSLLHFGPISSSSASGLDCRGRSSGCYVEAFNKDQTFPLSAKPLPVTPSAAALPALVATENTALATGQGTLPKKPLRSAAKVFTAQMPPMPMPRQRKSRSTLDIPVLCTGTICGLSAPRTRPRPIKKYFNSCGTQTNFVPLQEIKRLAEEYKKLIKDEAVLKKFSSQTPGATDDEVEKTAAASQLHYSRRSSIDNEDVSQSVSDTIKRYLRMARKKNANDDNVNRFKRVNYDRSLRNIRAKGEINPPGMDEDNSKAVQTLDAWPVISLDFIRGKEVTDILEAAHADWQRALDERIQKKVEFDRKLSRHAGGLCNDVEDAGLPTVTGTLTSKISSFGSCPVPTSPTSPKKLSSCGQGHSFGSSVGGLRLAGSQFLSTLWYGSSGSPTTTHHNEDSGNTNSGKHQSSSFLKFHRNGKNDHNLGQNDYYSKDGRLRGAMQKSKSSSNVGQFVSRKLLKSSSKNQSPPNTAAALSKWEPAEKFMWASNNGDRFLIEDSSLQNLTEIEAKILQQVAIEKISELNLGVNVSLDHDSKLHKRSILAKKKAITTSFFDINRRDDQGGVHGLFGNSLESCLVNDKKRCGILKAPTERGSRNSIGALFRDSGSDSTNKLHESVRSYESLPSSTFSLASPQGDYKYSVSGRASSAKATSGYFGNLSKSTSMPISRSQSDVRRHSQEFYTQDQIYFKEQAIVTSNVLQVPSFVILCIKYLEDRGLHKVGLFRVSTSKKRVKQMREEFDTNSVVDIEAETCPHDVATLLKEFLRDLPEPLLCSGLYKAFLETQRIRNRRLQLEAISHLIKLLPTAHRDTLYVLLKFLAKVASCSDDVTSHDGNVQITGNKMDSNNLATVFAPNILRTTLKNSALNTSTDVTSCGNSNEQESMSDAINVIRIMIDHFEEMFKVSAELIDIVYSHMLDTCPDKLYYICEQRSQSCREDINKSCSSLRNTDPNASHSISATSMQKLPTCNICSGVVVSSSYMSPTKSKRLYKRESMMHENDASRMPQMTMNDSKRYASRHSMTQKIRQYDRISNAANSSLVDRRKSSPNIFDNSGIVSATLQIPSAQLSHFEVTPDSSLQRKSSFTWVDDLDEVFCRSEPPASTPKSTVTNATNIFNYPNMPCIGDATIGQRMKIFNQYLPISGSLSFSTKMGGPTNAYRQVQITRQQTKQQQKSPDFNTSRVGLNSSTQSTMANTPHCTTDIDDSSRLVVMSNSMHMSKYHSSQRKKKADGIEPKLPVGIYNIAGAILLSKTADFDRMSSGKQQQTQAQSQPQTMQRSSNISVASIMPSTTTITTPTTIPHLYKRQEIIQSAKRLSNKK